MNPELQSKISIWRQQAADGTLSPESMREAIIALREGRVNAAKSAVTSTRSKAIKIIPSADDLLKELGL